MITATEQIKWHSFEEPVPNPATGTNIIYAYTYLKGFDADAIAGEIYYSASDLSRFDESVAIVAWAVTDRNTLSEIFSHFQKHQREIEEKKRLERIQQLEQEIRNLKGE